MNTVRESQCLIVNSNRRKQDEVKHNPKWENFVKRAAHIIKQGSSYDNILSAVANLLSSTNTIENSTDSILQDTPPLSSDTLEEIFIHMGENISGFLDLKKQTVKLDIERR